MIAMTIATCHTYHISPGARLVGTDTYLMRVAPSVESTWIETLWDVECVEQ